MWLTGHSLGGALAVVGAGRLAAAGHEVAGVVTFGQPRVCLDDLAANLAPRLRRRYLAWVNDGDVVPRLVLPYVHFGWRLTYDGAAVQRRDMSERAWLARGAAAEADDGMDAGELDRLLDSLTAGEGETPLGAGGDERAFTGMVADLVVGPHRLARYAEAVDRWLAGPDRSSDAAPV